MAAKEKTASKPSSSETSGGKILTNVIYLLTILFILSFFWQSITSFLSLG